MPLGPVFWLNFLISLIVIFFLLLLDLSTRVGRFLSFIRVFAVDCLNCTSLFYIFFGTEDTLPFNIFKIRGLVYAYYPFYN